MKIRTLSASLPLLVLLTTRCATAPQSGSTSEPPGAAPPPNAASTAPAQKVTPAADLVDHIGDSEETAVEVPADAPEDGIKFENDWIFHQYGKFRRLSGGIGALNGRRYETVEVELFSHDHKTVYFDITDNWNSWRPGRK
jgi:hypothetical protein